MVFQFAFEFHKDLPLTNAVREFLKYLFDSVIKSILRANFIKPSNQLLHYFIGVLLILLTQHADQKHDASN